MCVFLKCVFEVWVYLEFCFLGGVYNFSVSLTAVFEIKQSQDCVIKKLLLMSAMNDWFMAAKTLVAHLICWYKVGEVCFMLYKW